MIYLCWTWSVSSNFPCSLLRSPRSGMLIFAYCELPYSYGSQLSVTHLPIRKRELFLLFLCSVHISLPYFKMILQDIISLVQIGAPIGGVVVVVYETTCRLCGRQNFRGASYFVNFDMSWFLDYFVRTKFRDWLPSAPQILEHRESCEYKPERLGDYVSYWGL